MRRFLIVMLVLQNRPIWQDDEMSSVLLQVMVLLLNTSGCSHYGGLVLGVVIGQHSGFAFEIELRRIVVGRGVDSYCYDLHMDACFVSLLNMLMIELCD